MITTAIIGVSGFGAVHYNDLVREYNAGRCRVAAVAVLPHELETDAVCFLKSIGAQVFTDYTEMLKKYAGQLDLCCIPTGIPMHRPMTEAALAAGANVFVEKPLAPTLADARAMEEAEKKSGKFIAVGYQTIYQPETRRIKEWLLSGRLGKTKTLKCYALWPRKQAYYDRNNWAGRLFSDKGEVILDSPFTNALAHYLNLLSFYAGDSFSGTANAVGLEAVLLRANRIESCDTATIRIRTSDDKTLLFYCTHASEGTVNPTSSITCENGFIHYTQTNTTVTDPTGKVLDEFPSAAGPEIRQNIFDALFDRLNHPERFICSAAIASKAVLLGNAVFDAAPIMDVPASRVRVVSDEENIQRRVIDGIDERLKSCFDAERLLSTADYPFAVNSAELDLRDYTNFQRRLFL